QGFECHAGGHGAISNDGYMLPIFLSFVMGGDSHSQSSGYRSRRMPHAKGIVFTFTSLGKATDPTQRAVGMKYVTPTGQNFVAVRLVAYIPYQLIVGSVEYVMQGNGQFHHSKAGCEMPAVNGNSVNDVLTQFTGQLNQLILAELFQIG